MGYGTAALSAIAVLIVELKIDNVLLKTIIPAFQYSNFPESKPYLMP
jgi:hypothetical protein